MTKKLLHRLSKCFFDGLFFYGRELYVVLTCLDVTDLFFLAGGTGSLKLR